jgi:hypothetical protein
MGLILRFGSHPTPLHFGDNYVAGDSDGDAAAPGGTFARK